jgi:hypothetical protein
MTTCFTFVVNGAVAAGDDGTICTFSVTVVSGASSYNCALSLPGLPSGAPGLQQATFQIPVSFMSYPDPADHLTPPRIITIPDGRYTVTEVSIVPESCPGPAPVLLDPPIGFQFTLPDPD